MNPSTTLLRLVNYLVQWIEHLFLCKSVRSELARTDVIF